MIYEDEETFGSLDVKRRDAVLCHSRNCPDSSGRENRRREAATGEWRSGGGTVPRDWRIDAPVIPATHGCWQHDHSRLVAESIEPFDSASELTQGKSYGRGF